MQYRGDGRLFSRVSGETTTVYRYDRGWNAINQEDESGGLSGSSVYAPGAEVGERLAHAWGPLSDTVMACAYHDQLGSTRAWRWQNKSLIGRNSFAPYGELVSSSAVAPIDYALHVRDPYTLCFHAPYREYAPGSARWTTRDPLGMVDGPNMYGYVKDRPVRVIDAWGLFTVTGDCNGKANDIQAMVQEACDNLDAWITPDLKACVEKRCKTGKVRCQKGCKSGCENGNQGYNIGTGPIRSHTAVICVDSPQGPGGFTDTAIHEWVHSCGYDEQDKNDKTPPYGDGK